LGGAGPCSVTQQNAINAAVNAGTVVVVAAGNSNLDVANFNPANCQNVIVVAAMARDGSRAVYSNFSSPISNTTNPLNVTLAAPGGDQTYSATFDPGILSTLNAGLTTPVLTAGGANYIYYQGTSMATPHVAAAVALMRSKNSALTPAEVKAILSATASLTAFPSFVAGLATWDCALKLNCGAGILNANLAVQNSVVALNTSSAAIDFGSVLIGAAAPGAQTITLTNNSSFASAHLGTATITGNNASLFSIATNTCTGAIASHATCQISINYAPGSGGAHASSLTVPVTGNSPTLISLAGAAGGALTTTATLAAPNVTVGKSTTVVVTYTNPNPSWLLGAVVLSNPNIMVASTDNCSNITLASGSSCNVTVTISPSAVGTYSGTASLGLSGGGQPVVATISGSAQAAPAAGGGGGCSIMKPTSNPDFSLPIALLIMLSYWVGQLVVRRRD